MKYNMISIDGEDKNLTTQIGERLSAQLGIPCYQTDILQLAALRGHTSPSDLDRLEEITSSNLLHSIYTLPKEEIISNRIEDIRISENEIIRGLADRGPFLIIGHGIQRSAESKIVPFSVFTYSVWNRRTEKTVRLFGTQPLEYINKLKKYAGQIPLLNRAHFGQRPDETPAYHMMLDVGRLGIDNCARTIIAALD